MRGLPPARGLGGWQLETARHRLPPARFCVGRWPLEWARHHLPPARGSASDVVAGVCGASSPTRRGSPGAALGAPSRASASWRPGRPRPTECVVAPPSAPSPMLGAPTHVRRPHPRPRGRARARDGRAVARTVGAVARTAGEVAPAVGRSLTVGEETLGGRRNTHRWRSGWERATRHPMWAKRAALEPADHAQRQPLNRTHQTTALTCSILCNFVQDQNP